MVDMLNSPVKGLKSTNGCSSLLSIFSFNALEPVIVSRIRKKCTLCGVIGGCYSYLIGSHFSPQILGLLSMGGEKDNFGRSSWNIQLNLAYTWWDWWAAKVITLGPAYNEQFNS